MPFFPPQVFFPFEEDYLLLFYSLELKFLFLHCNFILKYSLAVFFKLLILWKIIVINFDRAYVLVNLHELNSLSKISFVNKFFNLINGGFAHFITLSGELRV